METIKNFDQYLQERTDGIDAMIMVADGLHAETILKDLEEIKASLYATYDQFMKLMSQRRQEGLELTITDADDCIVEWNLHNNRVNQIRQTLLKMIDDRIR